MTLVPILLGLIAFAVFGFRLMIAKWCIPLGVIELAWQRSEITEPTKIYQHVQRVHEQFWSSLVLLAYVALPPVSFSLLSSFVRSLFCYQIKNH